MPASASNEHLQITAYLFNGSNACATGRLLLKQSGLEYGEQLLLPGFHAASLKLRGFPGVTVPALKITHADGKHTERIIGTLNIAQRLHELAPSARLFPTTPAALEAVKDAEIQGEKLQNALRRIMYLNAAHDDSPIRALVDSTGFSKLPPSIRRTIPPLLRRAATLGHKARPERLAPDLARVAATLTMVDELVRSGMLGGDTPNAADLQLAPNLSALMNIANAPTDICARPWAEIPRRWFPSYPMVEQMRLPEAWFDQLRG